MRLARPENVLKRLVTDKKDMAAATELLQLAQKRRDVDLAHWLHNIGQKYDNARVPDRAFWTGLWLDAEDVWWS